MDRILFISIAVSLALIAAGLSWVLSFVSRRVARRIGALDQPTGGRKIHARPIPLLGGLGVAAAVLLLVWPLHAWGIFSLSAFGNVREEQVTGFIVALLILLLGGILDDRYALPPRWQFVFPALAALVVIMTGTGIIQVTNPLERGALSLDWWRWTFDAPWPWRLSLPSDLITLAWLLTATYAMKILDGLDGLVTGLTVVGTGIVAALSLSLAYFQPPVALLAGIVGGAYLGFLPRNIHPARQFLGEAGSTIAGFTLGFLAVLSSAKIAVALSALAVPITDVAIVVLGRIRRGQPWFRGDDTHLHFRLLKAGVPYRMAVALYWGVAFLAGILALGLQTRGKLFLIASLVVLAVLTSYVAGLKARRSDNA